MFEKLKQCGADIIINNLEIKYQTLELYKDLPIDEIKIGSHFVSKDSGFDLDLLKNIISVVKSLNYKAIINCVEDEKTLNYAIRNGADSIQGDFLFKKMDTNLATEFVKEYESYVDKIDGVVVKANTVKNTIEKF